MEGGERESVLWQKGSDRECVMVRGERECLMEGGERERMFYGRGE